MKTIKLKSFVNAYKQIKKLLNILRDKGPIGFEIIMKCHIEGSSEPKIITMYADRTANGDLNIRSSKNKNPDTRQSRQTLKKKLESIGERVHEYIVQNALDADWREMEVLIDKALNSGISADDLEYRSVAPIRAYSDYGYQAHFLAPILAIAHAREGGEALEKNDLNHASHCANRGFYWSSSDILIPNANGRFTARACTGGHGKDLRREPIKDKVAELLKTLAPEAGWASRPTAIKTVALELIDSHSNQVEECLLNTDSLPRTIGEWIKANPERFPYRMKCTDRN